MRSNRTHLAILQYVLALVLLNGVSLIVKHLSVSYSAAELSAYRNIFGLIPSLIALWAAKDWHAKGRVWKIRQWRLGLLRGVCLTIAQFCFYLSLVSLSFATASTLTYANALFMVALAAPVLGEKVGGTRWVAVIIGFVGVVWVVGPGRDAFSFAALLPLGAALFYALAGIGARLMDKDLPVGLINVYSASAAAVGSIGLAVATTGFTPFHSVTDFLWVLAMGGFGGSAVVLYVLAFRNAEQSDLAPFGYFGIPIAFGFGWAFFGEAPWSELFPGAVLIIISGLMVVLREQRRQRGD